MILCSLVRLSVSVLSDNVNGRHGKRLKDERKSTESSLTSPPHRCTVQTSACHVRKRKCLTPRLSGLCTCRTHPYSAHSIQDAVSTTYVSTTALGSSIVATTALGLIDLNRSNFAMVLISIWIGWIYDNRSIFSWIKS
jgi:hypothetical protein